MGVPMNKHLRTKRRLSSHTWFFCFQDLKNICNPISTSNVANIVQFSKRKWKNYEIFCVERVQCSMMGELKKIKILNLKSLIVASLPLEYKEIL